jgi:hypothetical protein
MVLLDLRPGSLRLGGVRLIRSGNQNEELERDIPSESRLDNGTEPVSSTVRIPSAMSVKPSERLK